MDCMMPVMDGFEATRIIKGMTNQLGEKKKVVIVGLSAMTDEKEINKWFDEGIDFFCNNSFYYLNYSLVPKPPKISDLNRIMKILDQ
jgi:CheY-like chemotaxis protein